MKKIIAAVLLLLVISFRGQAVHAQSAELQQLILNVEKLNQLRAILNQLYQGYQLVSKGYNTIKDLSEGNFNLHQKFLNQLLEVSPAVKKYKRIAEIITLQKNLVKEYKSSRTYFRELGLFNKDDLEYLEQVYGNLFDRSVQNLEELLQVLTTGSLRMNDAERLQAIDRIYTDMQSKMDFLRHFNDENNLLAIQRQKEMQETHRLKKLHGLQ